MCELRLCVAVKAGRVGCCSLMLYIYQTRSLAGGDMRDVATHGRFERSTVADYVIMFIVLLSDCIRIRHHARSAIAEGGVGSPSVARGD